MLRVVIVGGGITGLATAHALRSRAPEVEVTVLERDPRLGGNIATEREGAFVVDTGPDSWVANKPDATDLAKSLGLEGELIGTIPANRRVYVAWERGLHPLPEGFVLGVPTKLLPIVRTPLFSLWGKARMGLEPLVPRRQGDTDESIASFVSRRLGREISDRLVAPMLGGIYAGDASELSIRATLPQFVEAERKYGSLVWAMRAQRRLARARGVDSAFLTLRGGLGELIKRLAERIGGSHIRTGVSVRSLAALEGSDSRGRYVVELDGGERLHASHIVLAVPPNAAAAALRSLDQELAAELERVRLVSTVIVFLAFRASDVPRALDATGYIVPRSLGRPALAATWVTSKWEGRAPVGHVLVRVFLGGAGHEHWVDCDDAELVRLAREELMGTMGIRAEPLWSKIRRFVRKSPQPLVGHLDLMGQVRVRLASLGNIHVAGSGYDGVGLPDCVRQATAVANAILGGP